MIRLTEKIHDHGDEDTTLTLTLDQRIKCRLRVSLDSGEDAGLFLARGTTLQAGDLLRSEQGLRVRIKAADETLSRVVCDDPLLMARACYHLGNRHVLLQIEPGRISYLHDHVLDEMLAGLGLAVEVVRAPFEPEPGAYGGSAEKGHAHAHTHGQGHDHHHHH
ncbi:MAG: urease accessory protein UreE [Candidatus Thiodiazotropha sp.]